MTRDEALADLTADFEARVTGLGLQSFARGEKPRIPAGIAAALASAALEWAIRHGARFD